MLNVIVVERFSPECWNVHVKCTLTRVLKFTHVLVLHWLLRYTIGLTSSCHVVIQLEVTSKPIISGSQTSYRASCQLHLSSCCDWFTGLSEFFVFVGQGDYWFWFLNTQLKSAPLLDVRLNDNTPGSATSFTSYVLFTLNLNLLPSFLRNFVLASPASGLPAVWEARCGLGQSQERSTFFVQWRTNNSAKDPSGPTGFWTIFIYFKLSVKVMMLTKKCQECESRCLG